MSNTIPEEWVPINRNLAGDFIGFTFDNKHSSDFNLVRVSNGSRYESNLLPSFQDSTVQAEGKDGLYYFGSVFKEKAIKISTAFDGLTEENYRQLIQIFSDKKLHKLWFDETPYKVHYVKLKQPPTFKNICFDEGAEKRRVYKGEMDLEFTSYPSFGISRVTYIDEEIPKDEFVITYVSGNYENILHNHGLGMKYSLGQYFKYYGKDGATLENSYNYSEWKDASRLSIKDKEGSIYNPGELPADIKLIWKPKEGNKATPFPSVDIELHKNSISFDKDGNVISTDETIAHLSIKTFSIEKLNATQVAINSKNHLIEGLLADNSFSGEVFNKYHIKGDFFEIPQCKYDDGYYLKINDNSDGGIWTLEYTYYYV